ncbi:MAG: PAS domain-containing protein [Pseudomonadota bacterium]|nr:PAS domain-containing protein [Pseudomonadota bacterium]
MALFDPESFSCRAPASRDWARYWWSLRQGDMVPPRSRFDPVGVPALLRDMMICDLSEPGRVRIRLMGTRMVSSFGFDPTGTDYLDLVAPDRRAEAYRGFIVPARQPCGMQVEGENRYRDGRSMAVEVMAFPLRRDDGGGMQMVFVGSNVDPRHGRFHDLGRATVFHVFSRRYLDIGAGVPD